MSRHLIGSYLFKIPSELTTKWTMCIRLWKNTSGKNASTNVSQLNGRGNCVHIASKRFGL